MPGSLLLLSPVLREIESQFADAGLMQKAAAAAAKLAADLYGQSNSPILILVGPGNNGGDALETARLLRDEGYEICVVGVFDPLTLPKDAKAVYQRYQADGGEIFTSIPDETIWGLVIDGLFGIGLKRAPLPPYSDWIDTVNLFDCPILALDCPSGLDADTGKAYCPSIHATHTLSFIAHKPGLMTGDGPDIVGTLILDTLDIPHTAIQTLESGTVVKKEDFAKYLKPRLRNTHKGSFGSVGILGGDCGMIGAALLSARAALKLGAGRVYVGLLDPNAPTVDFGQPELMLRPAEHLLAAQPTALACGPGLGQSTLAKTCLAQALAQPLPLILDADALNLIANSEDLKEQLIERTASTILTPHPAEAARLLNITTAAVQSQRVDIARQLAQTFQAGVALKGCGTVLALPDGQWWINCTGNPGMATAGMGDVLTGLMVSLLAQHWPLSATLLAATYLHGDAADRLVAKGIGPYGLVASEIADEARLTFNQWISAPTSCA